MFKHIFQFEFGQWFNKPLLYIYILLMAAIAGLSMAGSGGLFDSNTATVASITMINSPLQICMLTGAYAYLGYLLLPSIIGATLYKDFKSETYKVLYSYPFKKSDYIFGKFFSSFLIAAIIFLFLGIGTHVGTTVSGVDQSVVLPFDLMAYLKTYAIWILPNLFLFSAIVFGVTLYTRNIIAGFVALAAIFFMQGITDSIMMNNDDLERVGAMLDPFGLGALNYYTKYWTIVEQNENALPLKGVVLWNRLVWGAIAIAIFLFSYLKFSFSYTPISFKFWKSKTTSSSPGAGSKSSLMDISLPAVTYKSGILHSIQSAWALTKIDLKYVFRSGPFIVVSIIGILFIVMLNAFKGEILQTTTLPVTRDLLLIPGATFGLFIALLTFIYTGMLIYRPHTTKIYQLEDATKRTSWSVILSRLMSVVIMQAALLGIIMITSIIIQIYQGYTNYEIGLYLKDLYGVRLINYVIWAMLAVIVYTLVPNFYLGLVILLVVAMGMNFLDLVGIEKSIYKYNNGPGTMYSDMSGFGSSLGRYFTYKLYWGCLGLTFIFMSVLFWRRGVRIPWKNRWSKAIERLKPRLALGLVTSTVAFLGLGFWIYGEYYVKRDYMSSKEREQRTVEFEKKYKKYQSIPHPRLVDVDLEINLFPETRDIKASGEYLIVNKSGVPIDSFLLQSNDLVYSVSLDKENETAFHDTIHDVMLFHLSSPMEVGDSMRVNFELENSPNTIFRSESPVSANGTFFNNYSFPLIGYFDGAELSDNKVRAKNGLPDKEMMPFPSDSIARMSNYISTNSDWIQFAATVSTSPDQIAMVPGKLEREWEADGRRYFRYRMQSKMLDFYNVISARYEKYEDHWNDVPVTIYYHKGHEYNLERMMKGAIAGLEYCSSNFSPYQHDQLRILEFPVTEGTFAQSFANTIPFSEGVGFIADVDEEDGVDFPFAISVHEVAHQWWAHQVIGANTKGSTMLSESLSEYVSLMVLKQTYGEDQMRTFLKDALDKYLLGRTTDRQKERPLVYVENQPHIHYNKGSLVFYALADQLGEDVFNNILKQYVDSVGFQSPPFTVGEELVGMIKANTPDSLQYFVRDMFEHITLYNNRVTDASVEEKDNGTYIVTMDTQTSKYRTGERGRRSYTNIYGDSLVVDIEGQRKPLQSLPLQDYIDIGIFGQSEEGEEIVLYNKRHKISEVINQFTITVDAEPIEVGIDPYNKLIDTNSEDNRKRL